MVKQKVLTKQESYNLIYMAQSKDKIKSKKALETLIRRNQGLVVSVAAGYWRKYKSSGLELDDFISAGNMGLLSCIKKFDPSKNFEFSTYATCWVQQCCGRLVDNECRLVRLPVAANRELKTFRLLSRTFKDSGVTYPEERAFEKMGITSWSVKQRVLSALQVSSVYSLDQPLNDYEDFSLGETIPSAEKSVEDEALSKVNTQKLKDIIEREFTEREKFVIFRRFGFTGSVETLAEIGKELDITRERVRQIEASVLKKLRLKVGKEGFTSSDVL